MTPDTYRERAQGCLEAAHTCSSDRDRAMLLSMAEAWLEMARRIEARSDPQHTLSGESGSHVPEAMHGPESR